MRGYGRERNAITLGSLGSARDAIAESVDAWTPRRVFFGGLLALLALRGSALLDPPYWDTLLSAFPQSIWSAEHGLSPFRLLREGGAYVKGGVAIYPFSVYPWTLALLWALAIPREAVFFAFHLASFASAAWLLASLFALARTQLGVRTAAFCAVALGCWPPFQALACQMGMEMPVAACGLAAVRAQVEDRLASSWLLALLGLLVKPTMVIVVGAQALFSALALAAPRTFDLDRAPRRRHWQALFGHAVLAALFLLQLYLLQSAGRAPRSIAWMGGFAPLVAERLWQLPEVAVAMLLALPTLAAAALRARRVGLTAVESTSALVILVFVAFYGQYEDVLPRYFLQLAPFLVLFLCGACSWSAALGRRLPRLAALLALAGAVNAHGAFYPTTWAAEADPVDGRRYVASNGHLLERSLEYRDDLELARRVARDLDRFDRDRTVIVANWPFEQLLSEPRLGYVDRPFRTASAEIPQRGHRVARRPIPFELVYRPTETGFVKTVAEDVRWIVSPNVFAGEHSRYRPEQDVLVERYESGRLRAFLLYRRAWEPSAPPR